MFEKNILIFCGPTITDVEASEHLDAVFLSPAQQGDIYKYYQIYKPSIIGLIDGYFENKPSPWHKEILYVMNEGCHVFGSSSMGALRAAELDDFGMVGIGSIYKSFKSEILIDDDEVAVVHGPSELGYPALSEAMVNIRATVDLAQEENVINNSVAQEIISTSKSLFYKKRNYSQIINTLSKKEKYESSIKAFSLWLIDNAVNLKKDDALELIRKVKEFSHQNQTANEISYNFEVTLTWEKMCREIDATVKSKTSGEHNEYNSELSDVA